MAFYEVCEIVLNVEKERYAGVKKQNWWREEEQGSLVQKDAQGLSVGEVLASTSAGLSSVCSSLTPRKVLV